jgi:hypothetical protein
MKRVFNSNDFVVEIKIDNTMVYLNPREALMVEDYSRVESNSGVFVVHQPSSYDTRQETRNVLLG